MQTASPSTIWYSILLPVPLNNWVGMNRLKWDISSRWLLKLSYEYATRLPDEMEVFGDFSLVKANPSIQPENSHNMNLMARYNRPGKTISWHQHLLQTYGQYHLPAGIAQKFAIPKPAESLIGRCGGGSQLSIHSFSFLMGQWYFSAHHQQE